MLALVFEEPGSERVLQEDGGLLLSSVNLVEVLDKIGDKQLDADAVQALLRRIGVLVISFDARQASLAASLRDVARPKLLSLADRACLALALDRKLPVLTADRVWAELGLVLDVQLIR